VNIDSTRQLELDSIVTFMPNECRSDLYLLHEYLHSQGKNDEERVWMFYGYFAIHTRYDDKRLYDRNAKFQTPAYTICKRKGVCRDFANAFRELCTMSGIPCLNVYGKVNTTFWSGLKDLSHLQLPKNRHQWNLVKLNDEWLIMDPTWSYVKDFHKYYTYDKDGAREYLGKTKIPDRTYYDAIPQNTSRTHKPYHPAFYLMEKVPSFKTAFRLDSKRDWYSETYDYNTYLDNLISQRIPEYSSVWNQGAGEYSYHKNPVYFIKSEMNYHDRLHDKAYKPNLQDYYDHLKEVDSLANYYTLQTGTYVPTEWYHELIDSLYIQKLEKQYAQE
jgi:hypothetical protein